MVPVDELDGAVDELASTLAAKSPAVLRLGRQAFYEVWDSSAADALPLLHAMLTVHTGTDDAAEGIAAFAEKRAPTLDGSMIHVDPRDDVLLVTIDRPERRNALDHDALDGLLDALGRGDRGSRSACWCWPGPRGTSAPVPT